MQKTAELVVDPGQIKYGTFLVRAFKQPKFLLQPIDIKGRFYRRLPPQKLNRLKDEQERIANFITKNSTCHNPVRPNIYFSNILLPSIKTKPSLPKIKCLTNELSERKVSVGEQPFAGIQNGINGQRQTRQSIMISLKQKYVSESADKQVPLKKFQYLRRKSRHIEEQTKQARRPEKAQEQEHDFVTVLADELAKNKFEAWQFEEQVEHENL